MATRRTPQANARAAPAAALPETAWNAASDLPRQQMTLAAESACAMFRGFEAMRRIQERAAHEALEHYSRAVEQIRHTDEPNLLMEIQAELLRFDLEGATQYWQQLGAAAVDMQRELIGCCAHMVDNGTLQRVTSALDGLSDLANGFNPFLSGAGRNQTH
jgi:hypothetical protein